MEITEGGLIVPDGTVEKPQERFQPYETDAIEHCAEVLLRHGFQVAVVCVECQAHHRNPLASFTTDAHGRNAIECDCRVTTFTRRRGKRTGVR